MKTTERDTDHYHITVDDNELYCPILKDKCMADKCAMVLFTETADGSNYYCGLVASNANIAWNESDDNYLFAPWTKSVMRERI